MLVPRSLPLRLLSAALSPILVPRRTEGAIQLQHWTGQRHQGLGRGCDGYGRGRVRQADVHAGLRVRRRRVSDGEAFAAAAAAAAVDVDVGRCCSTYV